jgi:hypothetical protein
MMAVRQSRRGAYGVPKQWPLKKIGVAALLLAEVVVLSLVAWSGASGPVFGLAVPADVARITMTDQHDIVHAVTVKEVVSPSAGWLIAQADWNDGVPDAVLGKQWVPAGVSQNVPIALDPQSPLPRRIYVTLLADLGQQRVLEYFVPLRPGMATMRGMGSTLGTGGATGVAATKDKPVIAGGTVVTAHVNVSPLSFAVGPGQAVLGPAMSARGATGVLVTRVVVPAQAWVSVTEKGPSGQTGILLGTKLVAAGTHQDVAVPLRQMPSSGDVIATLHVDLGTLGQFDYSPLDLANSPDQPFVSGGQTVSVPVQMAR